MADRVSGIAGGAVTGATLGAPFGPVGIGTGALLGGIAGAFLGGKKKKKGPSRGDIIAQIQADLRGISERLLGRGREIIGQRREFAERRGRETLRETIGARNVLGSTIESKQLLDFLQGLEISQSEALFGLEREAAGIEAQAAGLPLELAEEREEPGFLQSFLPAAASIAGVGRGIQQEKQESDLINRILAAQFPEVEPRTSADILEEKGL